MSFDLILGGAMSVGMLLSLLIATWRQLMR